MGVIREDVVRVSFDVDSNPFAELTAGLDEMKAAVTDGTDGLDDIKKISKEASSATSGLADDLKKTGTEAAKTDKTFTEMLRSVKDIAKAKVGSGWEKLTSIPTKAKSGFDKLKSSISKVKNLKLSDVGKGLDKALGKGVTASGKLFSGLKKAAAVGFDKTVNGVKNLATYAGKAATALGKGLVKATKYSAVAIGAAGAAIGGLVTKSVQAYADYEQLVGGVETLFGTGGQDFREYANSINQSTESIKKFQQEHGLVVDGIIGKDTAAAMQKSYKQMQAAEKEVLANAGKAWKTAGMSQNEYMETVTSFSASLISSLGGDTKKAAEYADMAITDMSDNANKMGTDMESIQNAYQGFAKQNYTMLDNLNTMGA